VVSVAPTELSAISYRLSEATHSALRSAYPALARKAIDRNMKPVTLLAIYDKSSWDPFFPARTRLCAITFTKTVEARKTSGIDV
jgi:hypothetical protein